MKKLLSLLSIFILSITLIGVDKASAATIYWPADSNYITSKYGWRTIDGITSFHRGIDIRGSVGSNAYAMHNGVVEFAGWDSSQYGHGSYGRLVVINHMGANKINNVNVKTIYAHLNSWSVSTFNSVRGGQKIGAIGASGNVTGPHLHFETLNCGDQTCKYANATTHNPETWYRGFLPTLQDLIEQTEATEMFQDSIVDIVTDTDRFYSLERLQKMTPEELMEIGYPDPYEFQ